MNGMLVIYRKELSDHFSSYRFLLLFAVVAMISMITAYMAATSMASNLKSLAKPDFVFLMMFTSAGAGFSLVDFISFFGPLIGIILGFDTINRERNEGTLSKLVSQPIYRDAVVNGKFLAGISLIAIMMASLLLVTSALGLIVIGIVPGVEALWRIAIYLVISIFYIAFWLGLSILFSIIFRSVATSALAALAAWIFLSFFVSLGANAVAGALVPDVGNADSADVIQRARIEKSISLMSPMALYADSTATIVDPMRKTTRSVVQLGMMERLSMARFSGPLPLGQSVLIVLPYIIALMACTVVCFGLSYSVFMRQEIRSL